RVADSLHQLTFNEAVHVFVWSADPGRVATALLENVMKRRDDGCGVGGRKHICRAERLRPRDAARHIIFEEDTVEAERDAEIERRGIGSRIEATGPERHAGFPIFVSRSRTVHVPLTGE